jgi:hypothetical protein
MIKHKLIVFVRNIELTCFLDSYEYLLLDDLITSAVCLQEDTSLREIFLEVDEDVSEGHY